MCNRLCLLFLHIINILGLRQPGILFPLIGHSVSFLYCDKVQSDPIFATGLLRLDPKMPSNTSYLRAQMRILGVLCEIVCSGIDIYNTAISSLKAIKQELGSRWPKTEEIVT